MWRAAALAAIVLCGVVAGLDIGEVRHFLGGIIHHLRSEVHALLGDKVVYLALSGFIFAAFAGLGGGLILDNVNQNGRRKKVGWALLFSGIPLFGLGLFLGLP